MWWRVSSLAQVSSSYLLPTNSITKTARCALTGCGFTRTKCAPIATSGGDVGRFYPAAIKRPNENRPAPLVIRPFHLGGIHRYDRSTFNVNVNGGNAAVFYGLRKEVFWKNFSSSSSSSSSPPQSAAISKSDGSEEQIKKRCEALLHDNVSAAPTTKTFNGLLTDLGKFHNMPWAADYASKFLEKMWKAHNAGMENIMPTKGTYNRVTDIFANSPNAMTRSKAIGYHEELEEMHDKTGDVNLKPDRISYTILIDAWSKSGKRGSGEKAEAILNKMQAISEGGDTNAKPNIRSFNSVLNCWAKEGNGKRAEAILNHMEKLMHHAGYEDLCPDTITYNTVIDAWSKSGKRGSGEKAEAILNKMQAISEGGDTNVKPNIRSFGAVLNCWAKEGNGVRAEAILNHMEKLMLQPGYEELRPDTITYSTVIDAWSKSGGRGSGEKAEALLNKMQAKYEGGDTNAKPDIRSFGAVLNCWAKEGNGERAEAILNHMEKLMLVPGYENLRPNTITYSTVIDAWAKSGDEVGVKKVEAVLAKMKKMKEGGNMDAAPSMITYSSVMSMYQKSKKDNINKAVALLNEMESLKLSDPSLGPDVFTYTTFLNILAKTKSPKKAIAAENIIKTMRRDPDLHPDNYVYNAVLRVCAYLNVKDGKLRRHALILACKILTEAQESTSVHTSAHTYTFYFQAIASLSSGQELQRLLKRSFEDCCKEGLLDDNTLRSLCRSVPSPLLKQLLNTDVPLNRVKVKDLPASWSRNTGFKKKGHRKMK